MNGLTQFLKINQARTVGDNPASLWKSHSQILVVAALAVLALHWRDAADMVRIWWIASTYNHCLFIVPIIAWLVVQRKEEVARYKPHFWLPGVGLIAVASMLWMLGAAGGIALFRHAGLILTLQALVPTLLGPAVTRALLFPIFYMVFLVPFGEELVPLLQTVTAQICMFLLAVFGIPANLNGIFITIPNGYFEVAEACSGVKFLIAMAAYGALVSNVCFQSIKRRAAFMAVAIVVPIIANGLRAFGTIYVAHKTSIASAEGFDHVVYGWIFFALVMALVMAIGWRFFDRKADDKWVSESGFGTGAKHSAFSKVMPFAGALLLAPMLWVALAGNMGRERLAHSVMLPDVPGWTRVKAVAPEWDAKFDGADHRLIGHYRNANGMTVDLSIALFGWQADGKEMVGFGQGAAGLEDRWTWTANRPAPIGGKSEQLTALGGISREVASFYVTHAGSTGSAGAVKLATLKSRLLGQDQAVAAILVSAFDLPGASGRTAIDTFLKDIGPPEVLAKQLINQARGR